MIAKKHLWRWLAALVLSGSAGNLPAQTNGAPSAPAVDSTMPGNATESDDETVQLPAYLVGTHGMGYVDANTVSGFKTGQALLDVPQLELVMTQDLLRDIMANISMVNLMDSLAYGGVAMYARGGTQGAMIRGQRSITNLFDDMTLPPMPPDVVDSYEVVQGLDPIYGAAVQGSLLATGKQPLDTPQTTINLNANSIGGYYGYVDSTGPVGAIDKLKLSYRAIIGAVDGGVYFNHGYNEGRDYNLLLKATYNQAIVVMGYDYSQQYGPGNSNGILMPSGTLWTGAGYQNADFFNSAASRIYTSFKAFRFNYIQNISDSWTSIFRTVAYAGNSQGDNILLNSINWNTQTIGGQFRENNAPYHGFETSQDFIGHWNIGKVKNVTDVNVVWQETANYSKFWTAVKDGPDTFSGIPFNANAAAAIAAIHVPSLAAGEYNATAAPGSLATAWNFDSSIYQQTDVIPKLLSLVGGLAWGASDNITDSNIAQYPNYTSVTHSPGASYFQPRLGAVVHVTKDISIYGEYYNVQGGPQSALDINGNRLPSQQLKDKEVGVKTALFNRRLVFNASVYNLTTSNVAVASGLLSPLTGFTYSYNDGESVSKGWDGSLTFAVLDGLQGVVTWFKGTVKNQLGQQIAPDYGESWSAFLRYEMPGTSMLKGLAFGGGANKIGQLYTTTGGIVFPTGWPGGTPPFLEMHTEIEAEAFINYRFNRHIFADARVTNLTDSRFAQGANNAHVIDASLPRYFSLSISYTF